jgi:type III restriction enzyme
MDSGAHFHKCDFQVHTPRDPQWVGAHYHTAEDRRSFAAKFIQQCRGKGLDAVAITDHHDMAFFRYIKEAARSELDDGGVPVAEPRQIVVFPGMELTLGVPCQALLLLDPNFDENLLSQLYGILAITQKPHEEPKQQDRVTRLDHITTLSQLHAELNRHDFLKGRYIILPNVSEGGNSTLLRSGNHGKYKEMPCVGGYVDGSIDGLGDGNRTIVDGKNRDYGFKSIGIFQTSDSRCEDGTNLGRHTTWVKWTVPTTEALRQACLARQTRLDHRKPELPTAVIESIKVSNSRFMGPLDLELNPQFNCLIGGRGTGKSTILEYLRWGLCDQPPAVSSEDDLPDFQAKRSSLIKNTLGPYEGVVTVTFTVNNVRHVVRRHSHTGELFLKIGDREFEKCKESDVRDLLPVQAYSQKQLSAVGVRTDELIRFIEAPIKQRLRDIGSKSEDLKTRIRSSYAVMQRRRQLQREIDQQRLEVESLTKQIHALRSELTGLSEDDKAVLARHDRILHEERTLDTWKRELGRATESVRRVTQELAAIPSPVPPEDSIHNKQLITDIGARISASVRAAAREVDAALSILEGNATVAEGQSLATLRQAWDSEHNKHIVEHEAVKNRASTHEAKLNQIGQAEGRIKSIQSMLAEKQDALTKLGDPEAEYRRTREEWVCIYRERGDLLERKCKELTDLSAGVIRATVRKGGGIERALDRCKGLLVGTGIRGKKTEDLFQRVMAAENPVEEWARVLSELEAITLSVQSDEDTFVPPETPILSQYYSSGDLERMARKLTEEEWSDLSLTELTDVPHFHYRQTEMDYIDFSDASAGQQATALLRVLLSQEGPPLVIDQPEEDLDNEVIQEIIKEIWRAKRRRQIVVSSHNANIVVNGDADLVVVCGYRTAGDHSGGRIKCQGAIDVEEINKEITVVMEGGKEAFRLRKEKYGF